jgi:hypothetical protein
VEIAGAFINELWHIGVFELIPDDCEMKVNAPLFAVAKPSQPGQWRIIADMKSGGQNAHIDNDPIGCIHPKTGQCLWYLGLPMGLAQSPSLACRFSLSMLHSLVAKEPAFQRL